MLFICRDFKNGKNLKKQRETQKIEIKELKKYPLINIIIPAWNKEKTLLSCIQSIKTLKYPHIRVIISAGGSDKTIQIANSFKSEKNFVILYQRSGGGKIKAINECLEHVSEGLISIIDADIILTDKILNLMIQAINMQDQNIVTTNVRPYDSIRHIDLVKYIHINRTVSLKPNFKRNTILIGQTSILTQEVIKSIKRFPEGVFADDGLLMGACLISKGYKIFKLHEISVEMEYPIKLRDYIRQNLRWIENTLFMKNSHYLSKRIKFFCLFLVSLYIFISFILLPINIYLFLIGVIFFFSFYLKRFRKIVFYKLFLEEHSIKFRYTFFIKMIGFILIDLIMNLIVAFEIMFYKKAYKKRKNLIKN